MADNYQSFSQSFYIKGGKKAVDWIKEHLDQFDGEMYEEGHPMRRDQEALAELYDLEEDYYYLGFEWDIDSQEGKRSVLCLYSMDYSNLDHAAHFMRLYLQKFDPKGCLTVTFANTCSKARPGEFGGGAAFVTADDIKWMHTDDWCANQRKAWRDQKAKAS